MPTYTQFSLANSDQSYVLADTLLTNQLSLDAAAHAFNTQWTPLANLGMASGVQNQSLGVEASKQSEWGTRVAVGANAAKLRLADESSDTLGARAYVRLSQGLFRTWGTRYNRAGLTRAENLAAKQALVVEQNRQDLIQSAVQRFYDLVLADQIVAQSAQALARSRQHLAAAQSRQSVGLVSKVDVYRAELALLNAESAHEGQLRGQERALEAFNELISRGMESASAAAAKSADLETLVAVLPDEWERQLPESHLLWSAHLLDKAAMDLELFIAERDLLPDLALNVSVEKSGTGSTLDDAVNAAKSSWSAHLQLRSTFDDFTERNALTRARLREAQFNRDGEALKRRILRNVRDAQADLRTSERRVTIAESSRMQSEQSLALAKFRYERGLSDNLDLLDAEAAFSSAKIETLSAKVNSNLAAVRLGHSLGILNLGWLIRSLGESPAKLGMQ